MMEIFDIGIIGGGPAGYSAAIRASQKGLKVVLFEKEHMGGVCLNKGCIPTKTIIHCADFYKNLGKSEKFGISVSEKAYDYAKIFNRKNETVSKIKKSLTKLVESHGVKIVDAEAKITGVNEITTSAESFQCKNIIIATGSKPAELIDIERDGKFVLDSDDILALENLPQNVLIIGSGAIGTEWARIFASLDKTVTVVELAPRLLPQADIDVSKRLERLFKKDKIKFYTETKIQKIENHRVVLSNGVEQEPDIILCAVGRQTILPETENVNIEMDGRFVKTNSNFQTNYESIFAIGDVNGKMQLAHSAVHQAILVVDFIVDGKKSCFDRTKIPSVIYGSPEIAWIGMTEQQLIDDGEEYKTSLFPVAALGKAQADDEIDGLVKVVAVNEKIVGAHIVSPEASSLVQQFALMIDNELKIDDVLQTTFAHPSYSEAVFESVLGLNAQSLSLPPSEKV